MLYAGLHIVSWITWKLQKFVQNWPQQPKLTTTTGLNCIAMVFYLLFLSLSLSISLALYLSRSLALSFSLSLSLSLSSIFILNIAHALPPGISGISKVSYRATLCMTTSLPQSSLKRSIASITWVTVIIHSEFALYLQHIFPLISYPWFFATF